MLKPRGKFMQAVCEAAGCALQHTFIVSGAVDDFMPVLPLLFFFHARFKWTVPTRDGGPVAQGWHTNSNHVPSPVCVHSLDHKLALICY